MLHTKGTALSWQKKVDKLFFPWRPDTTSVSPDKFNWVRYRTNLALLKTANSLDFAKMSLSKWKNTPIIWSLSGCSTMCTPAECVGSQTGAKQQTIMLIGFPLKRKMQELLTWWHEPQWHDTVSIFQVVNGKPVVWLDQVEQFPYWLHMERLLGDTLVQNAEIQNACKTLSSWEPERMPSKTPYICDE